MSVIVLNEAGNLQKSIKCECDFVLKGLRCVLGHSGVISPSLYFHLRSHRRTLCIVTKSADPVIIFTAIYEDHDQNGSNEMFSSIKCQQIKNSSRRNVGAV